MTTINKYRVYCSTDAKYEYIWSETVPTTCPTNTAHTIDSLKTTIVEIRESDQVTIKEESVPTGGNFCTTTMSMSAIKNTITTKTKSWPFPISALAVEFITASTHTGDIISMTIGEDTITGTITANVSPASAWVSQNYTVGQTVTYTDPTFGARVYTCTLNTVSNEVPTDTTYWKHGLEISVSQTVIDNVYIGYELKLYDGTNTDNVARVLEIDSTNNKVYVETNLTNSFLASTPTYVKQTAYMVKDYELSEPWMNSIGQSKIGGSYLPADTIVKLYYDNKSVTDDKTFVGTIEYLY